MKNGIHFLLLLALLSACQSASNKETPANTDTTTAADAVLVDPDTTGAALVPAGWAGTYAGTLPCADCEGIQTELMLAADGSYTLRRTYLGKANQKPVTETGTWQATNGNAGLLLNADNPDRRVEYRFTDGNTLTLLGRDGKELDAKLNYTLTKN